MPATPHCVLPPPRADLPAPGTEVLVDEAVEERVDLPWRVILFNDEIHTFEEVVFQVMKATRCSADQAEALTLQAHVEGKASVYEGPIEACLGVQGVLREIGLVTEIEG